MKKYLFFLIVIIIIGFPFIIYKSEFFSKGQNDFTKEPKVSMQSSLKIESNAFLDGELIPPKYTCDGENIIPPLLISNVPENAKSLVLIVDDPDAPMGIWNHLLLWNIDPSIYRIDEGKLPENAQIGKNDFGKNEYGGPCPPSGTHRYFFKLFALDTTLDLDINSGRKELDKKMEGHIITSASLMGRYSKR